MSHRVQPRYPRARWLQAWPPVIAASIGVLLAGCASPHARSLGPFSQPVEKPVPLADLVAQRTGTWRIAQSRAAGDPTFRLVANEPPPTPKTLAAGGLPVAPRGAAAGAGNVGFGNATWETASWDNRNAHNWSLSRATTSPSRSSFTDVTGTVESGAGGYGPVYTTNQARGVVTPQMMASAGHEWSRQADRFTQIGHTQSLQAQESWRAATQNAISYIRDNSAYLRETGAYTW